VGGHVLVEPQVERQEVVPRGLQHLLEGGALAHWGNADALEELISQLHGSEMWLQIVVENAAWNLTRKLRLRSRYGERGFQPKMEESGFKNE
jgi:hypothetical protein